MDREELSDAVWARIALHLPGKATDPGPLGRDNRLFVEAHAQNYQALGRSKGGLSAKVHAATDALGNPVRFILTGGERNDITQIEPLIQGLKARHVLADKEYDG